MAQLVVPDALNSRLFTPGVPFSMRKGGGGGGSLPDYGDPRVGLAYDSKTLGGFGSFGISSNFKSLSAPAAGKLFGAQLNSYLKQATLTDNADISTGTISTSPSGGAHNYVGIDLPTDGDELLVSSNADNNLDRAVMSTPLDITTLGTFSFIASLNVFSPAGGGDEVLGIWSSVDGEKLYGYEIGGNLECVFAGTPGDFSTITSTGRQSAATGFAGASNYGLALTPDERYFCFSLGNDHIIMGELNTPGNLGDGITGVTDITLPSTGGAISNITGVEFNVFDKKLFIVDRFDETIYQFSWTG